MPNPIPTLAFERTFWSRGLDQVAGIDEVGRGAWAGPVVAGAVILPRTHRAPRELAQARDSKLLSPAQRDALFIPICSLARAHAIGSASRAEIDEMGIVPATKLAMRRALEALAIQPNALLIDALTLSEVALPQRAIIRGDQKSLSIACASILAKVTRDRMMVDLDEQIPGYAFAQHKGYGTTRHRAAMQSLGVSSAHRVSYAPVRAMIERDKLEL